MGERFGGFVCVGVASVTSVIWSEIEGEAEGNSILLTMQLSLLFCHAASMVARVCVPVSV